MLRDMGADCIKVDSYERAYDIPDYEDTASLNCVLFLVNQNISTDNFYS